METAAESSGLDSDVYLLSRWVMLAFVMPALSLLGGDAQTTKDVRGDLEAPPHLGPQVAKPTSPVHIHCLHALGWHFGEGGTIY